MKNFFCSLVLFSLYFSLCSQNIPAKYWIQFRDKDHSPYSIEHPQDFLSQRAINNRAKQNIKIDISDLPINKNYVDRVLALDDSMMLFTQSKWLNGITVYSNQDSILDKIQSLDCVRFVERTIAMKEPEKRFDSSYTFFDQRSVKLDSIDNEDFDYGKAWFQVKLNNAHWLHRLGYHGEEMTIAVLDGGFSNVDFIPHFDQLRDDHRIRGIRNFVLPDENPMRSATHGTSVLSCIASYLPGEMVGTAPFAAYYLAKTEDGRTENIIEEDNWVAGIEWADSLGVQVLNSSLGYTVFDDSMQDRNCKMLNGNHSRASIAAAMAVKKGMIVCNSAGNEGSKPWKYIGCPAEAHDILSVGAVNIKGKKAPFSSFGPTADGRIKPDVCAVGWNTFVANAGGKTTTSNGTSFASPLFAGMIACLWQAFPNMTNVKIMDAVRQTASQAASPDNSLGYGIADCLKAYNYLLSDINQPFRINNFEVQANELLPIEFIINDKININDKDKVLIEISCRQTGSTLKKTYIIHARKDNYLWVKLPKLPKSFTYGFLDIRVSCNGIVRDFLVAVEN